MGRESLTELRVVNPCHASWDNMSGTEQVRHCAQCNKNVFNLSEMTQAEVAELVQRSEERLCVRYHQREDGTVLTKDCAVKDRVKLKTRWMLVALAATIGLTVTGGCGRTSTDVMKKLEAPPPSQPKTPASPVASTMMGIMNFPPHQPKPVNKAAKTAPVVMGDVCFIPSSPSPSKGKK